MTNQGKLALGATAAALLLLTMNKKVMAPITTSIAQFANKSLPRGIRNNNPGNLRKSSVKWAGKVDNPLESAFESFSTMAYGLRAAIRNANTHWTRGKKSIAQLVSIWAPPSENNTTAYVAAVAKAAGIASNVPFVWGNNDTTAKVLLAIFRHENGAAITDRYVSLSDIRGYLGAMGYK